MTDTKNYTDVKVKKLDKSEVEITASIVAEALDSFYKKALAYYTENVEIDGFRKGKAPQDAIIKHVGEQVILDRAARSAIDEAYPQIVMEDGIAAIGGPQITITKIALGNPLEFTAKTAVMPEVKLPDYKKISKKELSKESDIEVNDKDVEDALKNIKRERVRIEDYEKQKKDGVEQPRVLELSEIKDDDLKDLDDEFVATLGEFKTVADFEKHVHSAIGEEKKVKDKEKKRIAIVEAIIKETKCDVPELLVAHEAARMRAQMEADLQRAGVAFADYLKHLGKSEEELLKEWRPDAEKRAKLQLVLNKIAAENELEPATEDVAHELEHLLQHHPDADRGNARVYIETMKRNEMVFAMLEC